MSALYNGLVTTGETEWIGDPQFLSLLITDSEMDKSVSLDISSYGLARINTDSTCYSLENGEEIYAQIYGVFSDLTADSYNNSAAVDDTTRGSVAEGVDVPDAVLRIAQNTAEQYFQMNGADSPDYEYVNWRITSLEWIYTYDDIDGMALDVYRMNYEFLFQAPENVVLAGGMYITDEGWVCPTYPNCTYLLFDADSDVFYFAMIENDCYPGDETFTKDLTQRFEDGVFPQFTAQFTPTEGILEQAVKFPYDLDFRGYITSFSETSVSVDEIVWDTEGNDYPNGSAIINDDTGVTDYPLAEDCAFWILKDYWYPCQRLDFDAFAGFLVSDKAFTDQCDGATLWVFAENEDGEIVMIGMPYQP